MALDSPIGTLLLVSRANAAGKYRIVAHLRGGEATEASLVAVESGTAIAQAQGGGGLAVMKRLKLGNDAEPRLLERFADEARLCKQLDHPNLAKLLAAGQDDDGPVLVFEYLEGPSLARLRSRAVRRGSGVPVPIALYIVREIATGLAYAHALADENEKPLKVVHRDVSPENVTVTYEGVVKLTDFGMATTVASTAKSREDRVKGNVAYMAPEQARAEFSLDPRADLFALGVIFWELLTGRRLWEGLAEVDVLARLADDKPLPEVRTVAPAVPADVEALSTQALAKVRDERFDSAADFLEAVDKLFEKHPELRASAKDVGTFVTELFADEREKMRAVVEESRTAADSNAALPVIGTPRAPGTSSFADIESDPRLRFGVVPPDEAPVKRVVEVIAVDPEPDRKFKYVMAAVVVLVLGVVTIVAVTSPKEEKKTEYKPYVPPSRPSSSAQIAAAASGEPQEVTIDIRVTPPEAKLFVDGVRTNNPYRTRVVPAAFRHAIRAEADGYETRTQTVEFDRERSIEIALVPAPKTPAKRHAAPPPPPPPPPSASP